MSSLLSLFSLTGTWSIVNQVLWHQENHHDWLMCNRWKSHLFELQGSVNLTKLFLLLLLFYVNVWTKDGFTSLDKITMCVGNDSTKDPQVSSMIDKYFVVILLFLTKLFSGLPPTLFPLRLSVHMSWTLLKQPIVLQSPLVPLSHSLFPAVFSYRIFNSCSFYYHYYHYHYYKLAVLFSFAQTSPLVLHLTVIFLGCFHWARTECWYVVRWGFFFLLRV